MIVFASRNKPEMTAATVELSAAAAASVTSANAWIRAASGTHHIKAA